MKYIFISCLLFSFFNGIGQSPYQINWKQESVYLGTGLGLAGFNLYLNNDFQPLTEMDVLALDRNNINKFDRPTSFNYSIPAANVSDVLLTSSFALPLLLLTKKDTRNSFGTISLMYLETALLTSSLTGSVKFLSKRTRPFVYNEDVGLDKKLNNQARFSFFSGHTSSTTANYFFVAKVMNDFFPSSKLKPFIWGTAITASGVTAYLRVAAGKHFPTDVITGYLVGAVAGCLIPHFHKEKKDSPIGLQLGTNHAVLTLTF